MRPAILLKQKRRHSQERNPSQVLAEARPETSKSKAVLEEGKADIPEYREDEGTSQPDLERMQVIVVHAQCQAKDEVVDYREGEAGGDTIVREHVCFPYQCRSLIIGKCHLHDIMPTL